MKDLRASLKELGKSLQDVRESLNIPQQFGQKLETRRWLILASYFLYSYRKLTSLSS
jgi:hypothetical protein